MQPLKVHANQSDFSLFSISHYLSLFWRLPIVSLIFLPSPYYGLSVYSFQLPHCLPIQIFHFSKFCHSLFFLHCAFLILSFGIFSLTPFTSGLFPQFKSLLKRSFCVLQLNLKHIFTCGSALLVFFIKLYHLRRYWACLMFLCVCCCLFPYVFVLQVTYWKPLQGVWAFYFQIHHYSVSAQN